jgi:DNA repair protein RadC
VATSLAGEPLGLPDEDGDRRPRIEDLPDRERPRERLLEQGAAALSDVELVAVLLRVGIAGKPVLQIAARLLREHGGLDGLAGASVLSLRRRGLKDAKAATILAAVEMGRRVARPRMHARLPLDRPAEVVRYLGLRYQLHNQEVMGAVFLDARHRWLGDRDFFRGTLHRATVEPRQILKEALLREAAGIVLFHTHPSGDPTPSSEDLLFTRRMATAAAAVGVDLLDHLIIGTSGLWVSLHQRGGW